MRDHTDSIIMQIDSIMEDGGLSINLAAHNNPWKQFQHRGALLKGIGGFRTPMMEDSIEQP